MDEITIKRVSQSEASQIIQTRKPLGLFYEYAGRWIVAIDNSEGEAWTEEFKTLSEAFKWLKGGCIGEVDDAEDKEIANALNEVFPAPYKKPPLGIMPKRFHDEQRLESLKGAIERYVGEKCQVPLEWIVEYNQLVKEVK